MPSVKDDWLRKLRTEIPEVAPEEVASIAGSGNGGRVTIVDVRETDEYRQGRLPGAVHLPRGFLELEAREKLGSPGGRVIAYCAGGVRSLFAAAALKALGFEDVASMAGGFTRWKQGGLEVAPPDAAPGAPSARREDAGRLPAGILDELRRAVPEVGPDELDRLLGGGAILVDVREADEYRQGHLDGAIHLPRGFLELRAEQVLPDRSARIVACSTSGVRSLLAADTLRRMGYANAVSLRGGYEAWLAAGHAVEVPETLTERERERYLRHLTIDEVGEAGQLKLRKARVLCVGAGGLGSPAAYYLAAAGVGTLGIVDFDVVDRTNLQRQILHSDDRVGMRKTESARRTLLGMNPDITVVTHDERLTSENIDRLFSLYDVIVDGCDNFPTRYLVNDACVKHGKPNVHGSIYRFEGQVTVFWPGRGPCYRCLYPEPPPPEMAPSCAEAGVLGVLPGVVGNLEAVEAIKIILGIGDLLVGRLLTYDALEARFRELRLRRDPDCPYCAPGRPFPGYVDYNGFCGV
jgi:molybdopterin/thiamine biosynthesis adenylyltransferase/rhodanese-related sulfurtransferase